MCGAILFFTQNTVLFLFKCGKLFIINAMQKIIRKFIKTTLNPCARYNLAISFTEV